MTFSHSKEHILSIWELVWVTWAKSIRSSPEHHLRLLSSNDKKALKNFPAISVFSNSPPPTLSTLPPTPPWLL